MCEAFLNYLLGFFFLSFHLLYEIVFVEDFNDES